MRQISTAMEIGVYIHIPFCIKKCYYCNFYSIKHQKDLIKPYIKALLDEIASRGCELRQHYVKSIYFGGGTPTILETSQINAILESCKKYLCFKNDIEITIEANPATVTIQKLLELKGSGFNRISIGIQSLNDNELSFLGRIHNSDEGIAAFGYARDVGFENINIDLIYGIPFQKRNDWNLTLNKAIKLNPEHLSIYCLSIEKNTIFHKYFKENNISLLSEDEEIGMYDIALTRLTEAGYIPYEISNFSKSDFASKHNQIYWRNEEYAGFGASAYSYIGKKRYWNIPDVNVYINKVKKDGIATSGYELLSKREILTEVIMLGLRTINGIDIDKLNLRFNINFLEIYKKTISRLRDAGLIELVNNHIKLTKNGILLMNEVILEFI